MPSSRPCHIYLISEGERGPVKIGLSDNPGSRLRELQGGNGRRLRIYRTWQLPSRDLAQEIERHLHWDIAHYCIGGEWFDLHEDLASWFVGGTIEHWGRLP